MCGGEVDLISQVEDKWAAPCICVLFLSVLCNSEESLSIVQAGGNILQEIVSGRCVRGGRFKEAARCEWMLTGVEVKR
jgi:hypothetical protein